MHQNTGIFVRQFQAAKILGVTKETIRSWIKRGYLPQPVKIGPRASGWLREDFEEFIEQRRIYAKK